MTYQDYVKLCRRGGSWKVDQVSAHGLGPVERSEFSVLRGDPDAAHVAIAAIADARVAYLQAVKASRHFEDPSFMQGRSLQTTPPKDWLLPLLRAACSVAKDHADGEKVERCAASAPRGDRVEAVRALMIASNAYRNAGKLGESRRVLLKAFQLARGVEQPFVQAQPSGIDLSFAKRRQSAFHDLLQITDFRKHSIFPCSGTLLGLFRDNDFIPSDGDVDLGCLDPAGFEVFKEEMRKSGRFYLSPGRMESNFNAKHVDGPKVDISLYVPRENGWAKTSHVYEWRFGKFSLGELVTDYGRLPAPDPAEDYLSAMYEDWWVPRSGYDSRIDSPNLVYVSGDEVVIVLASHYLAAHLQGKVEACAGWRRKFERLPGDMHEGVGRFLLHLA